MMGYIDISTWILYCKTKLKQTNKSNSSKKSQVLLITTTPGLLSSFIVAFLCSTVQITNEFSCYCLFGNGWSSCSSNRIYCILYDTFTADGKSERLRFWRSQRWDTGQRWDRSIVGQPRCCGLVFVDTPLQCWRSSLRLWAGPLVGRAPTSLRQGNASVCSTYGGLTQPPWWCLLGDWKWCGAVGVIGLGFTAWCGSGKGTRWDDWSFTSPDTEPRHDWASPSCHRVPATGFCVCVCGFLFPLLVSKLHLLLLPSPVASDHRWLYC